MTNAKDNNSRGFAKFSIV